MSVAFIVLEGSEGAGKSSHIAWMKAMLSEKNKVVTTREPGGSPVAESLRQWLLGFDPAQYKQESLSAAAELLLVFAARSQHIQHIIKPALTDGYLVLCDRYIDSSYAYQGGGRGISKILIDTLVDHIVRPYLPDLVFYFDVSPHQAKKRLARRIHTDHFEHENAFFFQKVKQAYRLRQQQASYPIIWLDANQPWSAIKVAIKKYFNQLGLQNDAK